MTRTHVTNSVRKTAGKREEWVVSEWSAECEIREIEKPSVPYVRKCTNFYLRQSFSEVTISLNTHRSYSPPP